MVLIPIHTDSVSGTLSKVDLPKGLRVVTFNSRNKDNKDIANFKQRSNSFLTTLSLDELQTQFEAFVKQGVAGETCRMYVSLNRRNNKSVIAGLMHKLIDEPNFPAQAIPQKAASVGELTSSRAESQWLFDFDGTKERHDIFVRQLTGIIARQGHDDMVVTDHRTKNGWAVIVSHGFDTRDLMRLWNDEDEVSLLRDDKLCVAWANRRK